MLGIDCFCEEEEGEGLVFKFVGDSLRVRQRLLFSKRSDSRAIYFTSTSNGHIFSL